MFHEQAGDGGENRRVGGDTPLRFPALQEVWFEEDRIARCDKSLQTTDEGDRTADSHIDLLAIVTVAPDDGDGCIPSGRLHPHSFPRRASASFAASIAAPCLVRPTPLPRGIPPTITLAPHVGQFPGPVWW